jgi:hypothetical protein
MAEPTTKAKTPASKRNGSAAKPTASAASKRNGSAAASKRNGSAAASKRNGSAAKPTASAASKRNGSAAASKRNGSAAKPNASAATKKASAAKTRTTASKPRSTSKKSSARAGTRNARTTRAASAPASRDVALERAQGELQSAGSAVVAVARKAAKPVLAGGVTVAGIAGAVAAGRALTPTRRKVLGVTVKPARLRAWTPKVGGGLGSLPKRLPSPAHLDMDVLAARIATTGQRVGHSGKQLSKIAADLQKAGEATEQVGKHLSK